MSFSLYVHLPFCVKKCAYCDFESYAGKLNEADDYISAVLREARARKSEYGSDTLYSAYFGGGTPSLLSNEQLKRLTQELFELFEPEENAEITIEANPGTVRRGFFDTAVKCGINRASLGVQAYQAHLLKMLGRVHDFDEALNSVKICRDEGVKNISCDAMFALPKQSQAELIETLENICALNVQHISCYSLILEQNTPLFERVTKGELREPDEEAARDMQLEAVKFLNKMGFKRYEISNYAIKGYESRHNMVYWTGGEYLGLGCAAHSYMRQERFNNPDYESYMAGQSKLNVHYVDKPEQAEERIMLETRLVRGVDLNAFKAEFGENVCDKLKSNALKFKRLIDIGSDSIALNDEGMMVQNALVTELIDGVADYIHNQRLPLRGSCQPKAD